MNVMNSWTRLLIPLRQAVIFGVFLALCACSSQNSEAPAFANGKHAADWVNMHGDAFLTNDQQCRQCHGDNLEGGIAAPGGSSGPTCFSAEYESVVCHGDTGPFGHPGEFVNSHNVHVLRYPQLTVEGPQGFEECVDCHGKDFQGRPVPQPSGSKENSANCLTQCHGNPENPVFTYVGGEPAPHSGAGEWDETHSSTDQENAEACAECHRNRGDFRTDVWGDLPFQYDPETAPGCFNNTLCHGNLENPHSGVANWETPAVHGVRVKSSPENGFLYGFVNCSVCHGATFANNCANNCHVPPHADSWAAATGTYTHTTTSVDNVAACAECHRNANELNVAGDPGCFNNTLCHAAVNPHDPVTWQLPANHGAAAKSPVPPVGVNELASFSSCQVCHGASFNLETCGSCHGPQPHPADWEGTGTYTHTSTDPSNALVCFNCHQGGNNSPIAPPPPPASGASPGCFNNTLCHGEAGSPHVTGWTAPANHGASAKVAPSASNSVNSFTKCVICHQPDFSLNCSGCHTGTPHPADWQGTGIYTHQTTNGANAVVCAECHTAGENSPLGTPTPPPAGTAAGCFNNTLCHGQAVSPHAPSWATPSNHGASAKAASGTSSGYGYCDNCHGTNFTNNCAGACHNPPHPSAWAGVAVYTHQNTNESNALICANCHRSTAGTAGCFNNTLCHGQVGGTGPAHPVHMALPTPANACTTCHPSGAGPSVAIATSYNAKSGAASFDNSANTCANVSCHGGRTTPVWATGSIDVNTQCSSCHTYGTTQYNGPYTGNHNRSNHRSRACTACHDTSRLANTHFTTLNTPALNNPPATIKASLGYSNGRCSSPGCHGSESW